MRLVKEVLREVVGPGYDYRMQSTAVLALQV